MPNASGLDRALKMSLPRRSRIRSSVGERGGARGGEGRRGGGAGARRGVTAPPASLRGGLSVAAGPRGSAPPAPGGRGGPTPAPPGGGGGVGDPSAPAGPGSVCARSVCVRVRASRGAHARPPLRGGAASSALGAQTPSGVCPRPARRLRQRPREPKGHTNVCRYLGPRGSRARSGDAVARDHPRGHRTPHTALKRPRGGRHTSEAEHRRASDTAPPHLTSRHLHLVPYRTYLETRVMLSWMLCDYDPRCVNQTLR